MFIYYRLIHSYYKNHFQFLNKSLQAKSILANVKINIDNFNVE